MHSCLHIKPIFLPYPQAKFHYLVIPRRPIDYPSLLTVADLPLLRHLIHRAEWVVKTYALFRLPSAG